MKKIIISFFLATMLAAGAIPCCADAEMTLDIKVNYDKEQVSLSGVTPALYGQRISVVIYRPNTPVTKLSDITDTANPEAVLPLLNLTQILRIEDIIAGYDGSYEVNFSLADTEKGFYIVSVSGNGYMSDTSKASGVIYFETQQYVKDETLPALNAADKIGIEKLIREKELLFGVRVDADYEANKDVINRLFVGIRKADYGNNFTTMSQVQETFAAISMLRSLYAATDKTTAQTICEENVKLLLIDKSSADYSGHESQIYETLLRIMQSSKPESVTATQTLLKQSMGIIAINEKNAVSMTETIKAYATALGLSLTDYEAACKEYGASEINKAFVGRDFKQPGDVVSAFESRLRNISKKQGGGGNSSASGSRGSGGSGSALNVAISTSQTVKPEPDMPKFADVAENHWSYKAVQSLAEMGVISGDETGRFVPEAEVSREQFVKMLVLALGLYQENAEAQFSDIAKDRWSGGYIASAVNRGIVNGFSDGNFQPERQISRQDAAVMLYRAMNVKKISVTADEEAGFSDSASVSEYAKESVTKLMQAGVIAGFEDGSFRPLGTLTRAQAAKIIYELVLL